jgi:hypothetical protein
VHESPGNNDRRKNYQNDQRKNYQEVRELSNKNIQRLQRYDQCQQRSKHSWGVHTTGDGGCFFVPGAVWRDYVPGLRVGLQCGEID